VCYDSYSLLVVHSVLFYETIYLQLVSFFFFQAEDGIRDFHVTGVQTCALPISGPETGAELRPVGAGDQPGEHRGAVRDGHGADRSEERRVGKSVDLGGRRIIKKKKNKSYSPESSENHERNSKHNMTRNDTDRT